MKKIDGQVAAVAKNLVGSVKPATHVLRGGSRKFDNPKTVIDEEKALPRSNDHYECGTTQPETFPNRSGI